MQKKERNKKCQRKNEIVKCKLHLVLPNAASFSVHRITTKFFYITLNFWFNYFTCSQKVIVFVVVVLVRLWVLFIHRCRISLEIHRTRMDRAERTRSQRGGCETERTKFINFVICLHFWKFIYLIIFKGIRSKCTIFSSPLLLVIEDSVWPLKVFLITFKLSKNYFSVELLFW